VHVFMFRLGENAYFGIAWGGVVVRPTFGDLICELVGWCRVY